jgi:hypothetical protein
MTGAILRSKLGVPLSGYWWRDFVAEGLSRKGEPVLVSDPKAHARFYKPLLEEPALFLTLAETDPDPDALQRFASRYGLLGYGVQKDCVDVFGKDASKLPIPMLDVETLSSWQLAVRWLNHLVALWRHVDAGDRQGLEKLLTPEEWAAVGRSYMVQFDPRKEPIPVTVPEMMGFRKDDAIGVATALLHERLSTAMEPLVLPSLDWDEADRKSVFSFEARSLWGAILIQFAEAVGGGRSFQRCAACSRWFELAPGINRSDRQTCTDSCRQKLSKTRKERALQLHDQGKKPQEIAKEIGSHTQTVKGWIARRKGK